MVVMHFCCQGPRMATFDGVDYFDMKHQVGFKNILIQLITAQICKVGLLEALEKFLLDALPGATSDIYYSSNTGKETRIITVVSIIFINIIISVNDKIRLSIEQSQM